MKILVVRGNPRVGGVCERLADIFVSALKTEGAEVLDFDITRAKVSVCRGCFACTRSENHACVIHDDMEKVRNFLSSADALVCISPVYFYSMSAQMKTFFDRCFPFVCGYGIDTKTGERKNDLTFENNRKKFITISVASGRLESSFSAMSQTYRTIADAFGFEYCADIRRAESPYFTSLGTNSRRVDKILFAFSQIGKEFAKFGKISAETLKIAEQNLSPNDEIFTKKAKIFWELSKIERVGVLRAVEMKNDIRALISKLRNSNFLDDIQKVSIKFFFIDSGESVFAEFSKKELFITDIQCTDFDVEFRLNSTLFQDLLTRRIEINFALESGRAMLNGDSAVVKKIVEILTRNQ